MPDQAEVLVANKGFKLPDKKFILIFFLILLFISFITLYKLKITNFPFLNKNSLVATVAGEKIYLNNLQELAEKQYAKGAINNKVLKLTLDNLIEEKILELEAKKLKLSEPKNLLKSKVTTGNLDSREAYVVSFWVPSDDYLKTQALPKNQIDQTLKLRADIKKAVDELEEKVKNKQTMLDAAQVVYQKYPTLQSRLSFNGYILEKIKDQQVLSTPILSSPKLYTYADKKSNPAFFDFLFSLKKDEIKKFIQPDGSGGSVVQVVSVHTGANKDYAGWLEEKKKELVKFYIQL